MRGEQLAPSLLKTLAIGSPPLARGTVGHTEVYINGLRITPACAGNRWVMALRLPEREDHPRLRGEQIIESKAPSVKVGSPPLARGTARVWTYFRRSDRITPACAGNRRTGRGARLKQWDHPRLRGEQQSRDLSVPQGRGSPPLARGTAGKGTDVYDDVGITPACAGNSFAVRL